MAGAGEAEQAGQWAGAAAVVSGGGAEPDAGGVGVPGVLPAPGRERGEAHECVDGGHAQDAGGSLSIVKERRGVRSAEGLGRSPTAAGAEQRGAGGGLTNP